MISPISRTSGTLLLAAVAALCLSFAGRAVRHHRDAAIPGLPDTQVEAAEPVGNTVSGLPARRPDVYFAAIVERPLFAPGRRPLAADPQDYSRPETTPEVQPEDNEASARPELVLLGTMQTADGWLALVRMGDAPANWLPAGAAVADLEITSIGPDWASLASETSELRLELYPK